MADSLNLCQFVWESTWHLFGPQEIVELVRSVIGWEIGSGLPTRQTLDRLGLAWVLKEHCHENGS